MTDPTHHALMPSSENFVNGTFNTLQIAKYSVASTFLFPLSNNPRISIGIPVFSDTCAYLMPLSSRYVLIRIPNNPLTTSHTNMNAIKTAYLYISI